MILKKGISMRSPHSQIEKESEMPDGFARFSFSPRKKRPTRRQSQRPWLSRSVLRAARLAPATVVAHLKRSAKKPPSGPSTQSMKRLLHALIVVCLSIHSVAQPEKGSAEALPAFKVWPLFTLQVPAPPRSADNVFSFLTVDEAQPSRWRGFIKFRSVSLKSGDQVVAIEGRSLTDMKPNEGRRLLSQAEPGKKLSVEVRQPGSKEIRKAIIARIDISDETAP